VIAVLGVAGLAAHPTQAGTSPTPVGHLRVAIDTAAARADFSRTGMRARVVILQGEQAPLMRRLKARNPALRVLLYRDLSGMVRRDRSGSVAAGVATQDARPEWFLRNTRGRRFTFRDYSWIWAADVGNTAYQRVWANNVTRELRAEGWDGVLIDDANTSIEYHYDVARVAKYPTDAAYQAATASALAVIGARVRASGKLAIANIGGWKDRPEVATGWLRLVDGAMNEMLVKTGATGAYDSYDGDDYWERQLQAIKDTQGQGKWFLGVSHSRARDAAAARYGYATVLLGASGRAVFALQADYTNEPWFDEYDYALGVPLGPETRESSGVHRRTFSTGLVLVNPTPEPAYVQFGGLYSGSGLNRTTAATLRPRSALVLARRPVWVDAPAKRDALFVTRAQGRG
jgi:Hypothetical glycosyl hydrolase family 15